MMYFTHCKEKFVFFFKARVSSVLHVRYLAAKSDTFYTILTMAFLITKLNITF